MIRLSNPHGLSFQCSSYLMSGVLLNVMAEEEGEPVPQNVFLTGRETPHTLHGYNVNVHPSLASTLDSGVAGSSKVKITTVTNQVWQLPKGRGTIVASNYQFLAYVLEGKSGHVLRLIQPETSARALLKGFVGAVVDVSFAHSDSSLLACVDEGGNVYLWDMDLVEDITKAPTDALCVVLQRNYEPDHLPHRLVWSPYMAQDEEEEGPCMVVSHGQEVEVIDVHQVRGTVPTGMKIARKQLDKGIITLSNTHTENVCDLSLSPDGLVLATCGEDGHLKFWGLSDEQPRCLHDFSPHGGRPVSRLIFCDDHTSQDPSNQFWRFLLTASGSNSEIKLWCTVSWKCLQTIRFCTPASGPDPHILMNLDLSASYLVVTDAKRAAVHVIQLSADSKSGTASLTSLTEYLLKQPIFSFIIPGHAPLPQGSVGGASSDSDSEGEPSAMRPLDPRLTTVGLKLHTIHSKSMQELEIKFDPPDLVGVAPVDHTPSDRAQPSSLPAMFDSNHGDISMASFHSLTETGSPKLLTPSQFLSPSKPDPPLLPSPRDFDTPRTTPTSVHHATPPTHTSFDQSSALTSVTMETLPTVEVKGQQVDKQPSDVETNTDLTSTLEKSPSTDHLAEEGTAKVVSEVGDENVVQKELAGNIGDKELSESEEDVSPEAAIKVMTDICETLQLEPPQPSTTETFESFINTLADPTHLQEEGMADTNHLQETIPISANLQEVPPDSTHSPKAAADPIHIQEETPADSAHPPSDPSHTQDKALTDPAHLQREATSSPGRSEFVSLPKKSVGAVNEGTEIVNASAVGTPPENLASLKKVSTPGESPVDGEGVSPTQEEGVWPDIGGPDIPTKILPRDQDVSTILGSSTSVSESVDKTPVSEGDPNVSDDSAMLPPLEGAPVVSQELSVPSHVLTMPSGNIETTFDNLETPRLLLAEESHDQSSDRLQFESFESPLPEESHDQSRDQLLSAVPLAESDEPMPQLEVKGQTKETLVMNAVDVNSQSEGELSEGVAPIDTTGRELIALVAKQQEELCMLRKEQGELVGRLEEKLDQMQTALLEAQTQALAEQAREQQSRVDRVMRERQVADKARHDKLVSSLSSALTGALKSKLEHLVRAEMKNMVLPAMQRSMVSIQNDLAAIVSQRVTATDAVVKEGINQILQTRGLSETIGGAVAASLQRTMVARYEEVFKSTVLPGFEKACQEMFRQIDDAFRRGTTEYLGQLTQHNRQLTDMTLQQVTQSINSLVGGGQGSPLSTQIQACMRQEMGSLIQHIQQLIVEGVASAVAKEVQAAFEEERKQSPEAKIQEEKKRKEEEVHRLVGEQRFNAAFELALSTSDLKLVMFLCAQVNPDDVFDKTPCPLSQPVLLSLIQQLSVELQDQLELKIKYLEHSILALDVGSDITKSHMTPVVSQLSQQLSLLEQSFQANPSLATPTLSKLVKRLRMMALHLTAGH